MTKKFEYSTEVVADYMNGIKDAKELAKKYGCSDRTIYRVLEKIRPEMKNSLPKMTKILTNTSKEKGQHVEVSVRNNFELKKNHIDEELYEQYLLNLVTTQPPSIQICTELRNFLDKKQMLKSGINKDDDMLSPEEIQFYINATKMDNNGTTP